MNNTNKYKSHFEPWRMSFLLVVGGLIVVFYISRLFALQIIQGEQFKLQADRNRTVTISEPTTRGTIYDRNGFVLARNIPSYDVVITPAYLPTDAGAVQEIYRQLAQLIGIPVSLGNTDEETVKNFSPCISVLGISQVVYIGDTNSPFDPIQVKCNVDSNVAMMIEEKKQDWPGVGIQVTPVRDYPTGGLTSEVVGFLGPIPAIQSKFYKDQGFVLNRDKVGYAGIEAWMQEELGGKNGTRVVEVDVAGKELRDLQAPQQPVSGENVRLTIDTRLQTAAKEALVGEINYWNTRLGKTISSSGVVIAMNPKTGEILSLVSYPTYENNRMARLIPADYYKQLSTDPNHPLINTAISAELPPGSVFKMAAAIGILNEGVVTPDYQIFDPGKITIQQKFYANDPGKPRDYVCWTYKTTGKGHGYVDFLHGVAYSCDVYFYKVGGGYENEVPDGGLGIYRLGEYARALGYGAPTGIELFGEASGLIPDPAWKRINQGENWSTGDTYIATMGQGYVTSTPIQILVSIATLANDGKRMKPTLIRDLEDGNGNIIQPFTPTLVADITKDPVISVYNDNIPTGEKKTVAPWTIQLAKEGMRLVVTDGTAKEEFDGEAIPTAGKTGTAEYCDDVASQQNLCQPGSWPAHAWYVGYAPYDDPEIAVIAFVYNGGEGSTVAAPVVRKVIDAYFDLNSIDNTTSQPNTP